MNTMRFEAYQPISAGLPGLSATVGTGTAASDYAQTLQLAIELICPRLKYENLTGEVEFYSSTTDAKATKCKIGLGFYKHNLPLAPADWPKWTSCSMESIRQECKCWGAVEYLNGRPVRILEHRPKSPFVARLAEEFSDSIAFWQQFDPVRVGQFTETSFLELPDRSCLVQKYQFDCIEAMDDNKRRSQWLELPAKAQGNTWYVFRNKAHFDAWLELNHRLGDHDENYPMKPTAWDPFYL